MGYLYVLSFTDDLTKVGHGTVSRRANESARHVAKLTSVMLREQWVSEPHWDSKALEERLIHWCIRHGEPVPPFREVFTGLDFAETVQAATQLIGGHDTELARMLTGGDDPPGRPSSRLRRMALQTLL
jgi:hypothetical protein